MSEDEVKDPASGASGAILTEEEKAQSSNPADQPPAKKKRARRKPAKDSEVEVLEKRVAELEARVMASVPEVEYCHMCHKPGATIPRGNTGEFFHTPCLQSYRRGNNPDPVKE